MRVLLTLLILLCLYSITSAQDLTRFGFKFGVVSAGFINNSSDKSDLDIFGDRRLGPAMAVFIDIPLHQHFDMEFNLRYNQMGAGDKIKVTTPEKPKGTGEFTKLNYKLDYFMISSALNPKIKFNSIEMQATAGLSVNYLIDIEGLLIFDDASDLNFGYLLGGKLIFDIVKSMPLFFEVAYYEDLNPFLDRNMIELKNHAWQINFGFYYN